MSTNQPKIPEVWVRARVPNPRFSEDAIPGWQEAERIQRAKIEELRSSLREAERNLEMTRARLNACRMPPSARNVLFTQLVTSFAVHLAAARHLQYPYVAWNDQVYTVDEVLLGSLSDFGL